VRSGKHFRLTAFSHAKDFLDLMSLEEFKALTQQPDGSLKPIIIILVDGGPDENPRYIKNIEVAIDHFVKLDLDAIFIATNAPGRSAFNPVERRMAPLSKALSGLVDASCKTIDDELEVKFGFQIVA
jgi:hypothetical protein